MAEKKKIYIFVVLNFKREIVGAFSNLRLLCEHYKLTDKGVLSAAYYKINRELKKGSIYSLLISDVNYTIEQHELLKPEKQLKGGNPVLVKLT